MRSARQSSASVAAAIAQQRVEAAGAAVAIADQGVPQAPARKLVLGEQVGLQPLGALEPPDGGHDPLRKRGLQGPVGCQLLDQRRLERFERGGILAWQHGVLLGAKTVLERILRRALLAFSVLGPRDLAPFLRLASARAGLRETAAQGAAPALDMSEFLGSWR